MARVVHHNTGAAAVLALIVGGAIVIIAVLAFSLADGRSPDPSGLRLDLPPVHLPDAPSLPDAPRLPAR